VGSTRQSDGGCKINGGKSRPASRVSRIRCEGGERTLHKMEQTSASRAGRGRRTPPHKCMWAEIMTRPRSRERGGFPRRNHVRGGRHAWQQEVAITVTTWKARCEPSSRSTNTGILQPQRRIRNKKRPANSSSVLGLSWGGLPSRKKVGEIPSLGGPFEKHSRPVGRCSRAGWETRPPRAIAPKDGAPPLHADPSTGRITASCTEPRAREIDRSLPTGAPKPVGTD